MIEVLRAHEVGYLLYIGGNDSMDTANKIAQLAHGQGLDLVAVGVPKTIDNDVGDSEFKLIDHTPGYGSVARYWMHKVQEANEENGGSCPADPVLVMQAMGRKIGFIPAAARLADPKREMPLQIYLAESPCTLEQLADQVADQLRRRGRCMVVISEGFDVGDVGMVKDAFGHVSFGASKLTVAQIVVNYLNEKGLPCKGVRGATSRAPTSAIRWPTPRPSIWTRRIASARKRSSWPPPARAVSWRRFCATRAPSTPFAMKRCRWRRWPTANGPFRNSGSPPSGCDVTDDFVRYAKPLVGSDMIVLPTVDGRQRMTRFAPIYAEQKLPPYLPQADRK